MKHFVISLVSHCERVWWDPGYDGLRVAVESVLDLQDRVAMTLKRGVTSTFCTHVDHDSRDSKVVDAAQAPHIVSLILDRGNEVGLHVHAPKSLLKEGFQDDCIGPDGDLLVGLGIPRPATYTAGDWVTGPRTARQLEAAGFAVDCSMYALEGPMNRFGVELDYSSVDVHPYRIDPMDIRKRGSGPVTELPVSGNLSEFAGPQYEGIESIQQRIASRYSALRDGVDVFQVFWHPFELVTLDGRNTDALHHAGMRQKQGRGQIGVEHSLLEGLERLLLDFGSHDDVDILSARSAAEAWARGFST